MENMNKCPYCGAELQENAAFCLYCMRSLTEKKDVSSIQKTRNKKIILLIAVAVCAFLALVLTVAWIALRGETAGEGREHSSGSDAPETSASTEPSEDDETDGGGEWPLITSFEDFTFRIVQSNQLINPTYLWDSDGFDKVGSVVDGDGDNWDIYTTEVYKEGISVKAYFCEGGKEIILTVTGLTDDTYQEGISLADCLSASVYDTRVDYVSEILSNDAKFPMVKVPEEEDWMTHVGFHSLDDEGLQPGAQIDIRKTGVEFANAPEMEDQAMGVQVRRRTYDKEKLYDIVIYHTQFV